MEVPAPLVDISTRSNTEYISVMQCQNVPQVVFIRAKTLSSYQQFANILFYL